MTDDPFRPVVLNSISDLQALIGRQVATSDWIPVTQERILAFADVTQDRQWIHLDSERASRDSPYGTTIAHGFLTLSLLTEMFSSAIQIRGSIMTINYGLNRVRFPAPVPAGSRIRATFSVHDFKSTTSECEVMFAIVVEVENAAKPCCVAEWIVRYYI